MFITFLVSAIAHELVMSCITKKLRGYGFLAMMLQLPIVAVQKSKYVRGKTTLNVFIPSHYDFSEAGTDSYSTEPLLLVIYDFRTISSKSITYLTLQSQGE